MTSRGDPLFFCSWSGGKDSCLALSRASRDGGTPRALLTMLTEGGVRSRSHGLAKPVLEAQAQSLGVSLVTRASTWEHYEVAFRTALAEFRAAGIERGVFGDIDLQPHLDWVQRVCAAEGITDAETIVRVERIVAERTARAAVSAEEVTR